MVERLREYHLDQFVTKLPFLPEKTGDILFEPDDPELGEFYVRAPVESLDDLKLWTGIPNDFIDHSKHREHLRCVTVPHVDTIKGTALDPALVADAEYNILFGYVDETLLSNPFWKLITNGLLERWRTINILCGLDLVVSDGQIVTLANTQTAFFRKITMYPRGIFRLQNDCKIIVDTIEHIASP